MTGRETLGWLRAYTFAVAAIYVAVTPLEHFAVFPASLHEQIGAARLLPSFVWSALHDRVVLIAVKVVLALGLSACAIGVPTYRFLAPASVALFVLHQCLVRIDKSGHRELALLYCLLVLAAFPAADAVALRIKQARAKNSAESTYQLGLLLTGFVFLFTYAAPAVYRLAHAAPAIFLDGSMAHYVVANGGELRNGTFGFAWGAALVGRGPTAVFFLNVGFVAATFSEALALFCLVNRPFRWAWLAFCVSFHFANLLLLNIDFILNTLLAPA
ncbi:MAG TPA: hypothetical protein VI197_31665, partial [Polyangiaceae bacterium]